MRSYFYGSANGRRADWKVHRCTVHFCCYVACSFLSKKSVSTPVSASPANGVKGVFVENSKLQVVHEYGKFPARNSGSIDHDHFCDNNFLALKTASRHLRKGVQYILPDFPTTFPQGTLVGIYYTAVSSRPTPDRLLGFERLRSPHP
jgi:hypothetical protein